MAVVVVNEIPQGNHTVYDDVSARVTAQRSASRGMPCAYRRAIELWMARDHRLGLRGAVPEFRSEKLVPALKEVGGW